MRIFFRQISEYKLFDILPVDLILHFLCGALLVIIFLRFLDKKKSLLLVTLIAVGKEFYDSFALKSNLTEHLIDLFFTILGPLIVLRIMDKKKDNSN